MQQKGYEFDGVWDWTLKKEGRDDVLKALHKQEQPQVVVVPQASAQIEETKYEPAFARKTANQQDQRK